MFELNRRIIINYRVTNVAPDLDLDYNAVHRNWPIRTIINSQLWTGLWLALSRESSQIRGRHSLKRRRTAGRYRSDLLTQFKRISMYAALKWNKRFSLDPFTTLTILPLLNSPFRRWSPRGAGKGLIHPTWQYNDSLLSSSLPCRRTYRDILVKCGR